MSRHSDSLRLLLRQGPMTARQLVEKTGLSQPTVSRALVSLGDEIVRIGVGASIQYAIRDTSRGFDRVPVCRVSEAGKIGMLGSLLPVRPDGFVMIQADGASIYSAGLPWWMFDMRPQGYLGRSYASAHAASFGLSANPETWDDSGVMRVLMAHGHDVVGNLLLGQVAIDRFLSLPQPTPIVDRAEAYPRLARAAGAGELPGSSAGGEQPKFCACSERGQVIVKFSAPDDNPVTERWRDLLLAEHVASGILGVATDVVDVDSQRFLEVPRFDRMGEFGRLGMVSLKALDAEFVGNAAAPWPVIVGQLAADGHVEPAAVDGSALLWAFGVLIGNTDMHTGNLSFVSRHGRPHQLAPAYDMLPMAFAPRSGGALVDTLPQASLTAVINGDTWRQAIQLATAFLDQLRQASGLSSRFAPCLEALGKHIDDAAGRISRLD